jgi:hypothetical protein
MNIKRTNREDGTEEIVDLELAVDKVARSLFSSPSIYDEKEIEDAFKLGASFQTCSFIYKGER